MCFTESLATGSSLWDMVQKITKKLPEATFPSTYHLLSLSGVAHQLY